MSSPEVPDSAAAPAVATDDLLFVFSSPGSTPTGSEAASQQGSDDGSGDESDASSSVEPTSTEWVHDGKPRPFDAPGGLRAPGFGMAVNAEPESRYDFEGCGGASAGIALREQRMMRFISDVTDELGWEHRVFDEADVDRWRAETDVSPEELDGDVVLSEEMFDFVSYFGAMGLWDLESGLTRP
ncbi:DUF4246 family protein [Candidatus Bathyarchaeota archaeon]|nr:DUF4246 family protein [Candidatus Bathyarchaeota archaeon]